MNVRVIGTLQAIRLFFVRREINELQGEKYFFTKKCISVSNVHFAALLSKVVMILINVREKFKVICIYAENIYEFLPIYSMHMLLAILNRSSIQDRQFICFAPFKIAIRS